MNDFLLTELAHEHHARLVRAARDAALVRAAERENRQARRDRRLRIRQRRDTHRER